MAAGLFLKIHNSTHFAVVVVFVVGDAALVLLVLGATLVLPITRRPLLNR